MTINKLFADDLEVTIEVCRSGGNITILQNRKLKTIRHFNLKVLSTLKSHCFLQKDYPTGWLSSSHYPSLPSSIHEVGTPSFLLLISRPPHLLSPGLYPETQNFSLLFKENTSLLSLPWILTHSGHVLIQQKCYVKWPKCFKCHMIWLC